MPSRRQFLLSSAAFGAATIPGTAAAGTSRPPVDVDAALNVFGSGAVSGRVDPRALPHIGEAADRVAAEAPEVADGVAGRLPTARDALAGRDGGFAARDDRLGAFGDASLRVETVAPAIDGVDALAVGVDFTARGPVVRARVTGADGALSRTGALDALADAGLPVAALDPFAVPDGDDLALYAGVADRDEEQPFVLVLLVVVLAAVVGTFVLGFSGSASGGSSASGSAREAPQIAFSYEYRSDTRRVTITHDGGDSVPASELQVAYESDGETAVDRWRDDDGTVTAGDSFTTRRPIDSGSTLRIIWQNSDGSGGAVLGEFTAP